MSKESQVLGQAMIDSTRAELRSAFEDRIALYGGLEREVVDAAICKALTQSQELLRLRCSGTVTFGISRDTDYYLFVEQENEPAREYLRWLVHSRLAEFQLEHIVVNAKFDEGDWQLTAEFSFDILPAPDAKPVATST